MLKKLSRNQIAEKMGLSSSFVGCFLSRPEFHKLNINGFFIISSAFKDSVKDFLKIKLFSTKTTQTIIAHKIAVTIVKINLTKLEESSRSSLIFFKNIF